MADAFTTPEEAASASDPVGREADIVWSEREGDWAAVVVHERSREHQEHVVFCERTPDGWVARAWDVNNNFYAYNGATPPWKRETNNPVGCWVHRRRAGEDVIAVRVGSGDEAIEQPVVDGRWYVANFEVRQWGPSRPWQPLTAIQLRDGTWTNPVTDRLAMSEDAYVEENIKTMQGGEASEHLMMTVLSGDPEVSWRLLQRVVEAAPDDLLGDLGAGDVETFFRNHGDEYWDRIEARARQDPKMAKALACAAVPPRSLKGVPGIWPVYAVKSE